MVRFLFIATLLISSQSFATTKDIPTLELRLFKRVNATSKLTEVVLQQKFISMDNTIEKIISKMPANIVWVDVPLVDGTVP